jgi:hypothetical protein
LRKYLAGGIAVTVLAVFGGAAVAQTPQASMNVTLSPKKAGTKKKPKSTKLRLVINNNDSKRTASKLAITLPKTLKLSGKGFPKCTEAMLAGEGKSACPKKSKVGSGTATALLGVNTPAPQDLTFKLTAYVGGAKAINFYLEGVELPVVFTTPGKLSGRKLTITIPEVPGQQPAPGTWAGLKSIDTTLQGKIKKNVLIGSTGCKKKKAPFTTAITFVDNGVAPAGTVTTKANAKCS